ncbi:flavodoxin [Klebsiella pneumoniae]|nr:flavodoxin [Klebsiella pneumoniae]
MAEVGIFVGTMYGKLFAGRGRSGSDPQRTGTQGFTVYEDPQVNDWESYTGKYVLVVTSTTGQGDLPDSIVPLYEGIKDMYQPHLRYGIIALGDSTYANFCGGGLKFDQLLQEQGAKRIGEMLKIDASEDPEPESVSNPWVEQWATLLA